MSKNYLVQPDEYGERKADYKAMESIQKKFTSISYKEAMKINPNGASGNVKSHSHINRKTLKIEFADKIEYNSPTHVPISSAISAALGLYRGICMFSNPKVETAGNDGYKCPWWLYFKHNETGAVFALGEWKGAFGFWTPYYDYKKMPKSYKRDITEFINLLLSDRAPHPYDNLTAGGVA